MSKVHPPLVGVDWGTSNRRAYRLDAAGECVQELADDQGMLAARGRFEASLAELLGRFDDLPADTPVLMSGMVGSAQGWLEVPYLASTTPLAELARHATRVPAASMPQRRCLIVPGLRHDDASGVDVMRGEETQLLGALELGQGDGWMVLPGTHCKWVELRHGRVAQFATYMTGELFALLSAHGTLSAMLTAPRADASEAAFSAGIAAAGQRALSNALFGCRARVVTGVAPAGDSAAYLSGLLIGTEWADVQRRSGGTLPAHVTVLGTPALAARHAQAGALLGCRVSTLEARAAYLAALRALSATLQ